MAQAPIGNCDEAIAFLLGLVRDDPRPYGARAALAQLPVAALLERVGNPQLHLPVVHVAGSKGKGSTALYLEAILHAAGLATGCFTSPHLQRWTERLRLDARESTPQAFADVLARLQPHVQALLLEDARTAPSFFDVLTAAALLEFAEVGVNCAIVEAGIGGRLDATNVVQPRLTCITSVELEHTDKLGTTLSAIAGEKAGIVKAGIATVTGRLPAEAQAVIRRRAADVGAVVSALGQEIRLDTVETPGAGLKLRVYDGRRRFSATLPGPAGPCAAHNAALAIACAARVMGDDSRLEPAIEEALSITRPPGRMELVGERPWVVVDGAHTPESARALSEMLSRLPARSLHLLVSLSAARNAAAVLAPLLARAASVTVTSADPGRSRDAAGVAAELVAGGYPATRVRTVADPGEAVRAARATLGESDLLCVAGSMYMAGVAREMLLGGAAVPHRAP